MLPAMLFSGISGSGKTAMLISYSEYASQIKDEVHRDIITKIGYSQVPGRTRPMWDGTWAVNPNTEKMDAIRQFFQWFGDRQNSYYLTILSGQSASIYPYQNHELVKLYPWLS